MWGCQQIHLQLTPKIEMMPQLYEVEGATLEPTFPMIVSLHIDGSISILEED